LKTFFAFTLAEVLITLGIIGVVAEMTIPTLMNNVQDQVYKTAYKQAYSSLSQALIMATNDDVLKSPTGPYDSQQMDNFKTIMSYFKVVKTCYDNTDNSQCWQNGGEGWNSSSRGNGYPLVTDLAVIDNSGMNWANVAGGYAAFFFVDTNGLKKPNQMGKDRFMMIMPDATGNRQSGIPVKVVTDDDNTYYSCIYNKCATEHNYYATSWIH